MTVVKIENHEKIEQAQEVLKVDSVTVAESNVVSSHSDLFEFINPQNLDGDVESLVLFLQENKILTPFLKGKTKYAHPRYQKLTHAKNRIFEQGIILQKKKVLREILLLNGLCLKYSEIRKLDVFEYFGLEKTNNIKNENV